VRKQSEYGSGQRALAATGFSQDSDYFPSTNLKIELPQDSSRGGAARSVTHV